VRLKARESYGALLERGQTAVLAKLRANGSGESAERWEEVRTWLTKAPEMAALGELADVLAPLAGQKAKSPVRELAAFLGERSWSPDIRFVTLEVPERLNLRPAARALLKINHPASKREPAMSFEPFGSPTHDETGRLLRYRYKPTKTERIVYRPGQKLWATLEMADGRYLTWSESPSQRYLIL